MLRLSIELFRSSVKQIRRAIIIPLQQFWNYYPKLVFEIIV